MSNLFSRTLAAGALPYSALTVLLGLAFYVGRESAPMTPKVVIAERGRIIIEAVMDRHDMPKEQISREVLQPIKSILAKYKDQGYVVLDSVRDESGNFAVAALPDTTTDITAELQAAVVRRQREGDR